MSDRLINLAIRLALTIVLVAVLLFCAFGYLASYEPLAASAQITARLAYGGIGALVITALIGLHRRRPTDGKGS